MKVYTKSQYAKNASRIISELIGDGEIPQNMVVIADEHTPGRSIIIMSVEQGITLYQKAGEEDGAIKLIELSQEIREKVSKRYKAMRAKYVK